MEQSYSSVGVDELQNRFGFHKGTIEGPNATAPRHSDLRIEFLRFADLLDTILPPGRAKAVALTELESASMWAHKAIAQLAPVVLEDSAARQLPVKFHKANVDEAFVCDPPCAGCVQAAKENQ